MTAPTETCQHCGCAPATRELRTLDPMTSYCVVDQVCEACYLPAALIERDAEASAADSLRAQCLDDVLPDSKLH